MSYSVAAQVLLKLKARLDAIDGTGEFTYDLTGCVHMRRPTVDLIEQGKPCVFIHRRIAGETRELKAGSRSAVNVVAIWDVIGAVTSETDSDERGLAAEALLADITRALELDSDRAMFDAVSGKNLTGGVEVIEPEIDTSFVRANAEVVGVGVRCVWPHKYGDPSFIT